MSLGPEGREILGELMIDRFIPPREEWYESLRQMHRHLARVKEPPDALKKP